MSISPRVINLKSQESVELSGVIVARGEMHERSRLTVSGDLKLGKFHQLSGFCFISVRMDKNELGGTLIMAEEFAIPTSGDFYSDKSIVINKNQIPAGHGIFDRINFVSPKIKAGNLNIFNNGQRSPTAFYPKSPLEMEKIDVVAGSSLELGEVCGPQGSISGFEFIKAKSITGYKAESGQGIITGELYATKLSDVLVRAKRVVALQACGHLEFLSYDLDPHPGGPGVGGLEKGVAYPTRSSEDMLDQLVSLNSPEVEEDFDLILAQKLENEANGEVDSSNSFSQNSSSIFRDSYSELYGEEISGNLADRDRTDNKRIGVAIQNLYSDESNEPTKVIVSNGDLSVGLLSSTGVQVLLKNGSVIVDTVRTCESTCGQTMLIAPKIYILRQPSLQALKSMKLYGEVYIAGKRALGFETQL